ncbi:MAG: radical SAM protein [Denitromonas halophila]|nr:MAG: radical SAM protein [Denitromonas halophila]
MPNTLKGVTIQLGLRCPLKCSHCYVTAGPTRSRVINAVEIEKIIRGYATYSNSKVPRRLAITGGEPFAMRRELKVAYSLALENKIEVHVNTSGHFATTQNSARRALEPFRLLASLEVSVDKAHEEYIDRERPLRCVSVAKELGIPVQVAVQELDWEEDIGLRLAVEALGVPVYVQDHAPVGDRNTVKVVSRATLPLTGPCSKVGMLVFDEFGNCFPCTSCVAMSRREAVSGRIDGFSAGSIGNTDFANLAAKALENTLTRIVGVVGPNTAADLLGLAQSAPKTHCDVCINMHCTVSQDIELQRGAQRLLQLAEYAAGL